MKKITKNLFWTLLVVICLTLVSTINVKAAGQTDTLAVVGAQVNKTQGRDGLRFVATSTEYNEELTYGMVVCAGEVTDLTVETPKAQCVEGMVPSYNEQDSLYYYYVTIYNIPPESYTTCVTAKAYVKDSNNNYTYAQEYKVRDYGTVAYTELTTTTEYESLPDSLLIAAANNKLETLIVDETNNFYVSTNVSVDGEFYSRDLYFYNDRLFVKDNSQDTGVFGASKYYMKHTDGKTYLYEANASSLTEVDEIPVLAYCFLNNVYNPVYQSDRSGTTWTFEMANAENHYWSFFDVWGAFDTVTNTSGKIRLASDGTLEILYQIAEYQYEKNFIIKQIGEVTGAPADYASELEKAEALLPRTLEVPTDLNYDSESGVLSFSEQQYATKYVVTFEKNNEVVNTVEVASGDVLAPNTVLAADTYQVYFQVVGNNSNIVSSEKQLLTEYVIEAPTTEDNYKGWYKISGGTYQMFYLDGFGGLKYITTPTATAIYVGTYAVTNDTLNLVFSNSTTTINTNTNKNFAITLDENGKMLSFDGSQNGSWDTYRYVYEKYEPVATLTVNENLPTAEATRSISKNNYFTLTTNGANSTNFTIDPTTAPSSAGTITLTATATYYLETYTATCEVEVVDYVAISYSNKSIYVGDSLDAKSMFTVKLNGTNVTVTDEMITYPENYDLNVAGTYEIVCSYQTKTVTATVKVLVNPMNYVYGTYKSSSNGYIILEVVDGSGVATFGTSPTSTSKYTGTFTVENDVLVMTLDTSTYKTSTYDLIVVDGVVTTLDGTSYTQSYDYYQKKEFTAYTPTIEWTVISSTMNAGEYYNPSKQVEVYVDGSKGSVSSVNTLSSNERNTPGTYSMTVSTVVLGQKIEYNYQLEVVESVIVSATSSEVTYDGTKTMADVKALFKVTHNGSTIEVTDEMLEGSVDFTVAGTYTVTCTYNNLTATVTVNVVLESYEYPYVGVYTGTSSKFSDMKVTIVAGSLGNYTVTIDTDNSSETYNDVTISGGTSYFINDSGTFTAQFNSNGTIRVCDYTGWNGMEYGDLTKES